MSNFNYPDYLNDKGKTERATRFLRPQRKSSNKYRVVSGGIEACIEGYEVDREGFDYVTVEYIIAGVGELILNEKKYKLSPGTVFFYDMKTYHKITCEKGRLVKYFLNIDCNEAINYVENLLTIKADVYSCKDPLTISKTFDEIIKNGSDDKTNTDEICFHLAQILFYKLNDNYLSLREITNEHYQKFTECKRIIEQEYMNLNSLKEIADLCNTDPIYLCKIYKKYTTNTPYKELIRHKMNHAVRLLNTKGYKVRDVASELKFDDQFNFSRTFKSVFGISPKTYQMREQRQVKF